MPHILDLLNFKSTKERDDFIIAILVVAFFAWLLWWLYPRFMTQDTPSLLPDNSSNAIAVIDTNKDSDGDGIFDDKDECIDIAGLAPSGCPKDSDGDGVYDSNDKCPQIKGLATNNGCPTDSDGDGVYDINDKCPKFKGLAINNGCPPDSDGDGFHDLLDRCPKNAGKGTNDGCPTIKIEEEDKKVLEEAIQSVEFETASAKLKRTSRSTLYRIAKILNKYPDYKLKITGHTDNQGDNDSNLLLSENRAKSCMEYLISQGINEDRISYKGSGSKQPIDSNETEEGKAKNRRVEFKLHH